LKEDDIILGIEDKSVITGVVKTEEAEPCPRKVDGDRTIYLSRDFPVVRNQGRPILCDFGEGRLTEHEHDDDIMLFQYRAPEVILGVP
jgi:serine/threonine-protein kinase SRPK3